MAQPSSLIISQDTIGTGVQGEAFKGGSSADAGGGKANKVRIINNDPQSGNTDVKLLWVPHDADGVKLDTDGEATLTQVGPHEWTFEPTAGTPLWGKWRIRAREVVGGANVDEVRIFGIASPAAGLFGPAFNEDADPTGSLLSGAGSIADSEDNEGGTIDGWLKDLRRTAERVESLTAANQGVALGAATWEFDDVDQVDSDPGPEKFKMNNVSSAAATELYFDIQSASLIDISDMLAALDVGAFIYGVQKSDSAKQQIYKVTGPATDFGNFDYVKVPVLKIGVIGGATWVTGQDVEFLFLLGPGGAGGGNVVQTGTPVDNFITGATGADNGAGPGANGDDVGTLGGDGGDAGLSGLSGGKGGAANGATGDGGQGGTVSFLGGEGGPSSGGTQGTGGGVEIDAGSGDVNGQVTIGTGSARRVISGRSGTTHEQRGGWHTPLHDLGSSGSTVTPDLNISNVFEILLTGNVTLTFANLSDGQSGRIHVTQDGAGSRTMVKGTGVVMPGGAIVLSGGAGETDTLAYEVVGANVRVWVEALDFS